MTKLSSQKTRVPLPQDILQSSKIKYKDQDNGCQGEEEINLKGYITIK